MPLTSTLPSLSFRALMPRRDATGGMNICRRVGCESGRASLLQPSLSFRAAGPAGYAACARSVGTSTAGSHGSHLVPYWYEIRLNATRSARHFERSVAVVVKSLAAAALVTAF